MSGFLLGLVIGVLINLATALFSREKALNLIPWMVLYLFIHASFVVINVPPVNTLLLSSMTKLPRWSSYVLVMIAGAILAAAYWHFALIIGSALDHATVAPTSNLPSGGIHEPPKAITVPTADDIADAIRRKSEPSSLEKARRYRLRKELTQYLVRGGMEKDTFRMLLQPARDENGKPVDPTEKLGKAMLRIQEWHSELTFYVIARLGEDYGLWLMTKTHSEPYPASTGNVPGLSQSWDTVASGVAKVEQLLRDFPDLTGGAEAAAARESEWADAREFIEWSVTESGPSNFRVTFKARNTLENPILRLQFAKPLRGKIGLEWERQPIIIGAKRAPSPDLYEFEILGKWPASVPLAIVSPSKPTNVSIRFW